MHCSRIYELFCLGQLMQCFKYKLKGLESFFLNNSTFQFPLISSTIISERLLVRMGGPQVP